MSKTIELIFDFGSPNAYLAYHALPPILQRTGASLVITPCLLGGIFKSTGNQAPMLAFANVKGKMAYEMLEMNRFITRENLSAFRMNPHFPVNTLLAMRGLVAAGPDNRSYVQAVLTAMWETGHNVADATVLAEVLTQAGFDAADLLTRAQSDTVKQELAANTADAVERGVFGVPTMFVNGQMFFGKERLGQIEIYLTQGVA